LKEFHRSTVYLGYRSRYPTKSEDVQEENKGS
jgi:hypothetical protein